MKKLIALLLILACAFSLAACKKDDGDDNNQTNTNNVSNDVFTKVTSMLSTSRPTKIVGSTVIVSGDTTLDGYYTLIMGKIDGKAAATYDYNYERLISVEESGSLDYVTKPEVVETVYKEYLEGYGVRVDGGAWDASAKSFAPAGSPFSLTVNADLIAEASYDEATKTLTCKVAKDKTSEVLGQAEDLPVDITLTIVDDGASINAVFITYTIPAAGKDTDAIEVTIKTFYTYRLEIINIDLGVEE